MPRRTMTVTRLSYQKRNARSKWLDVAKLPDDDDLLHFFYAFANSLKNDALVEDDHERYNKIEKLAPFGRTLGIVTAPGRFGEEGEVRNVRTGAVASTYGKDQANTVTTHAVLVVPKKGTAALLFTEKAAGVGGTSRLLDLFKTAFQARYNQFTFRPETIVEGDLWLKNAQLEKVTATLHNYSSDAADKNKPKIVGDLQHSLSPRQGNKYLPAEIWTKLKARQLDEGSLLGFPNNEQPDEIVVRVGSGGVSKSFVLGKEKSAGVSYRLTGAKESALSEAAILKFCLEEADDIFERLGVDWDYTQSVGTWSSEEVSRRWGDSS